MNNELQIFDGLKVKEENGQVLFDAETVAIGVGLTEKKNNVTYVIWKRLNQYLGLSTEVSKIKKGDFITESQMYKLALKTGSSKAEKFQDWVTDEVLPSIRKTGVYQVKPLTLPEQIQTVAQGYVEIEKDVNGLKDDVNDLKENFGLPGGKRRSLLSARSKQVTTLLGGHDSNAYREISRKVFARMGHDFKERFEVARYEDVPMSRFDEAMEYTKHWQLPTNLALDVRDLNSQTELEMEA